MRMHEHDEEVCRVAADTLETLALICLVPEEEVTVRHECSRRVLVTFEGPFNGTLSLGASEGVTRELAGNMLGLRDSGDASPTQREDALKELGNVICGNILPVIAGEEPVFHVSAPRLSVCKQPPGNGLSVGAARLDVVDGVVEVELFVEEPCLPQA